MSDWQPKQYLKFKNERTQPTIDLAGRIDIADPKRIIDIGCGPGNSTEILRRRWPGAEIIGLDNSANMLEKAAADHPDIKWILMDASSDLSSLGEFDVVFSNAVLQWIPNHEELIPKLYRLLSQGGVLAVQAPYIKELPVYSDIIRTAGSSKWSVYFRQIPEFPKHCSLKHYYDIVCDLTENLAVWQTDYIHVMNSHADIVEWYKGTGLRPFLDMLPGESEKREFTLDYVNSLYESYPAEKNGKILLPFRRVFFLAYR